MLCLLSVSEDYNGLAQTIKPANNVMLVCLEVKQQGHKFHRCVKKVSC